MPLAGLFEFVEVGDRNNSLDDAKCMLGRLTYKFEKAKDLLELVLVEYKNMGPIDKRIEVLVEEKHRFADSIELSFGQERAKLCGSSQFLLWAVGAKTIQGFLVGRVYRNNVKAQPG